MPRVIGIRREDKNRWERRAPLTPEFREPVLDAQEPMGIVFRETRTAP